ncbi:MAG: hypothetical protein HY526_12130 [Betaproteobacteria bacterium]|nr:hypothetical protein [Betaproteobacteria bacterium]
MRVVAADGYPAVISGQVNWIPGSPISALPREFAQRVKQKFDKWRDVVKKAGLRL